MSLPANGHNGHAHAALRTRVQSHASTTPDEMRTGHWECITESRPLTSLNVEVLSATHHPPKVSSRGGGRWSIPMLQLQHRLPLLVPRVFTNYPENTTSANYRALGAHFLY